MAIGTGWQLDMSGGSFILISLGHLSSVSEENGEKMLIWLSGEFNDKVDPAF